jgi:NADPH:quinone reductase-like Zn-dependent oxidoreductase
VTGVCSTTNRDLVASLGASTVLDYTVQDFTAGQERYDLILDAVGERKSAAFPFVNIGESWPPAVRVSRLTPGHPKLRREDLISLGDRVGQGVVRPVIDRSYALDDIVDAHRYVDLGHKRGNVILAIP